MLLPKTQHKYLLVLGDYHQQSEQKINSIRKNHNYPSKQPTGCTDEHLRRSELKQLASL
ncbi:MAG: hypothetical protein J6V44_07950 [Methanobrevibacter sp.]|nr:hypothetical protein [Methanobrevibacter sp.]